MSTGTNPQKARIANIVFALYILAIITLLVIPTSGAIKLDKYFLGIRTDHCIHATMFLPFMSFIWIRNLHHGTLAGFLKFFLVGILFAGCCESLHYFIKYRSFDIHDFYANSTGLSIGSLVFLFKRPRWIVNEA